MSLRRVVNEDIRKVEHDRPERDMFQLGVNVGARGCLVLFTVSLLHAALTRDPGCISPM